MPDQIEIDQQKELLARYRQTLSYYLQRQALLTTAHAPPDVFHGIREARDNIRRIKGTLRDWGVEVEDEVDDEPQETSVPLEPPDTSVPGVGPIHHVIRVIARATTSEARRIVWIGLIGALVLILGGVVIKIISLNGLNGSSPTTAPGAATPTEVAIQMPPIAPPLTTTVQITPFAGCPSVTQELSRELTAAYVSLKPPMTIETPRAMVGEHATGIQENSRNGDLSIQGSCGQGGTLAITLTLHSARGAPEVYEPPSLSLREKLPEDLPASQAMRVTRALAQYVRRDYADAAKGFGNAALLEPDTEARAWLYVLRGNSLLFVRQDDDAEKAFAEAARNKPKQAAIVYNQALAQTNMAWGKDVEVLRIISSGILSEVLDLEPDFELARSMQGRIWLVIGSNTDDPQERLGYFRMAEATCTKAATSQQASTRALALDCLARAQIIRYDFDLINDQGITIVDDTQFLSLASDYWSAPRYTRAWADFVLWGDQEQLHREEYCKQAIAGLRTYLAMASDDVHLSLSEYTEAQQLLDILKQSEKTTPVSGDQQGIGLPPLGGW